MSARLIITAPHSGSGKTTVSAAICAALRERSLRVAPFKVGPDYLDPTHLEVAAGASARNLDTFLLDEPVMHALFARHAARADVSVIEGVMGAFDGRDAASDAHSTADLARQLRAPLVLVIDAGGAARSVAAVALGFRAFAPDLAWAGVILNRVGSARHAQLCEVALAQVGVRSFGFVLRDDALSIPGRHLGLHAARENPLDAAALSRAARHLKIDELLGVARTSEPLTPPPLPVIPRASGEVRIGVAQDEAFSFYYPDSLELLEELGASLVPFSPLRDAALPDVDGLYLGGGYPELFAENLSRNAAMRGAVRAFAASGRPVVGECGGMMYLGQGLRRDEKLFEMCGVTPLHSRMSARVTVGYREVRSVTSTPLCPAGHVGRAHEFHYSELVDASPAPAYQRVGGAEVEGYARENVLASYLHLHFWSDWRLAMRFVEQCRAGQARSPGSS